MCTNDWFVIKTKSRCEKKVFEQLERLGYTAYLPLQTTVRLWSDRKKKVDLPLIPSVVFVQNLDVNKELLYSIAGFHSILRVNGKIGRVLSSEILQLKIIVGENMEYEPYSTSFSVGEEVEIIAGPLRGYFAKAIDELTTFRVLLDIPVLGIGYNVSVPKNNIRKLK